MQSLRTSRLAVVFALTLMAGPLSAQAYHWDGNVNGGYQSSTHALSQATILDNNAISPLIVTDNGTVINTTSNGSVAFKPSGILGAQVGYWFTRVVGFRINGAWSPSGLKQNSGGDILNGLSFSSDDLINRVNLWSATGDVMLRMVKPRPKFEGVEWLPYAALGAGAQFIGLGNHDVTGVAIANDTFAFNSAQLTGNNGAAFVCIRGICRGPASSGFAILGQNALLDTATFFVKQTTRFTGLLGLGMDVRVAKQFAFRLEAGDRLWSAPIYRALQRDLVTTAVFVRDHIGKTVNQFYFTAGANVLFGLEPAPLEPVAIQPAPPPPPPPAPSTESINVCVIDPSVNGGIKSVDALRNLNTGDTTVVANGSTVSLSSTLPHVPVVSEQDWFQTGRPLDVGTTSEKIQFVTTGGARVINASDLAFLGTVYGLPVYADRSLLGPIEGFNPGTDLTLTVDQRPNVRRAIEAKIAVVYVPLQPTGCVFQPMQQLEKVRKNR